MTGSGRWRSLRRAVARRPRREPTIRSQQDLSETAMAMLTLWVTFDEQDSEDVARTTHSLMADMNTQDLGYLVLHMAGLCRTLAQTLAEHEGQDVGAALRSVARGVHERGMAG